MELCLGNDVPTGKESSCSEALGEDRPGLEEREVGLHPVKK